MNRDVLIKSFEEEVEEGFKYAASATGSKIIDLTPFSNGKVPDRVYLDFTTQLMFEVWMRAHKHCSEKILKILK